MRAKKINLSRLSLQKFQSALFMFCVLVECKYLIPYSFDWAYLIIIFLKNDCRFGSLWLCQQFVTSKELVHRGTARAGMWPETPRTTALEQNMTSYLVLHSFVGLVKAPTPSGFILWNAWPFGQQSRKYTMEFPKSEFLLGCSVKYLYVCRQQRPVGHATCPWVFPLQVHMLPLGGRQHIWYSWRSQGNS